MEIKDSGCRREFSTGAVRDDNGDKGRCDLLPLAVVSRLLDGDPITQHISNFMETGSTASLYVALARFCVPAYDGSITTLLLEVAKHFADGAKKYGDNNWQKGLPVSCYIDSAVRHYLKFRRGDKDEPHDRAFIWNIMCCIWEVDHHVYEQTQ